MLTAEKDASEPEGPNRNNWHLVLFNIRWTNYSRPTH